jgi:hypothetical protein
MEAIVRVDRYRRGSGCIDDFLKGGPNHILAHREATAVVSRVVDGALELDLPLVGGRFRRIRRRDERVAYHEEGHVVVVSEFALEFCDVPGRLDDRFRDLSNAAVSRAQQHALCPLGQVVRGHLLRFLVLLLLLVLDESLEDRSSSAARSCASLLLGAYGFPSLGTARWTSALAAEPRAGTRPADRALRSGAASCWTTWVSSWAKSSVPRLVPGW